MPERAGPAAGPLGRTSARGLRTPSPSCPYNENVTTPLVQRKARGTSGFVIRPIAASRRIRATHVSAVGSPCIWKCCCSLNLGAKQRKRHGAASLLLPDSVVNTFSSLWSSSSACVAGRGSDWLLAVLPIIIEIWVRSFAHRFQTESEYP